MMRSKARLTAGLVGIIAVLLAVTLYEMLFRATLRAELCHPEAHWGLYEGIVVEVYEIPSSQVSKVMGLIDDLHKGSIGRARFWQKKGELPLVHEASVPITVLDGNRIEFRRRLRRGHKLIVFRPKAIPQWIEYVEVQGLTEIAFTESNAIR